MKKIVLIFSCLSVLTGAIIIIITSILNQLMPRLGYMAFQAAGAGSYSSDVYKMNFGFTNFVAVIMIITGIIVTAKLVLHPDIDQADKYPENTGMNNH
jgi:hypothetical protein